MFWHNNQTQSVLSIACSLGEASYCITVVEDNKRLIAYQSRHFEESEIRTMPQALAADVERMGITAQDCKVILLPGQYQLILMDMPDVPEDDLVKALRWNLKGLSDYDLDEVCIDTYLVPNNENEEKTKGFVAIVPLSTLHKSRALLEAAFLNVTSITIAEMGWTQLLSLMERRQPALRDSPVIIISICNQLRKLHVVYKQHFYLIREFSLASPEVTDEPIALANLQLEVERSAEYCMSQFNIPRPVYLFFTPSFYVVKDLLEPIGKQLGLTTEIIDLNHDLEIVPPLSLELQGEDFCSIVGALTMIQEEGA
jgi:MSHA biogenesis protein MshI